MQLQGIVFIQIKENDILVTCQGNTDLFKEHISIHKKYNHSRQLNYETKLYSFQGTLSLSSFKQIYPRSMKHVHSGKLYPFKEICSFKEHIYSFKFKAICSFKETIFIEHCCIRGIAEIFIQKLSPATL